MAYQSLYRRYRPQKFSEIRGQEHVVRALRNAVRDDRVGHAYLLSGPRGTGKTTAARILAKVLNCEAPSDGEPCGECESCRSIEAGTSFDLHELDAASNNKVDDIRDLLSKVALGTPGRTKVYLLDEVHMLTPGAENALLKTLEEPPDHVVFVLATTEPHKVVSTIRSRTQQLQLTLIAADEMSALVQEIAADAGLDVDEEVIGHVVKAGGGSARDTLSALDQVVAAGGIGDTDTSTADLLRALVEGDPGLALAAVEAASERGVDPRRIGERFVDALRTVFLVRMGSPPGRLSEPEQALADEFAGHLSPAAITHSLEVVGRALVDMRQAPDPRIDLEVALVRITGPAATGDDTAQLIRRIEALEARLAGGAPPTAPLAPSATGEDAPDADQSSPTVPPASGRAVAKARAALKPRSTKETATARATPAEAPSGSPPAPPPPSMRQTAAEPATGAADEPEPTPPEPAPSNEAESAGPPDAAPTNPTGSAPTLDSVRAGWRAMLDTRSTPARARFSAGEVTGVEGDVVHFVVPNEAQRKRCDAYLPEIEAALSDIHGRPLTVSLATGTTDTSRPSEPPEPVTADHEVDIHDLTDADPRSDSVVERIHDVFPGAEIMSQQEG